MQTYTVVNCYEYSNNAVKIKKNKYTVIYCKQLNSDLYSRKLL